MIQSIANAANSSASSSSSPPSSPSEYSESIPGAPLEAVLYADELFRRPTRPIDPVAIDAAIKRLLQGLNSSPQTILQSLADTILEVLQCDSAGVSLVNDDNTRFWWPAIAGVWQPHIGGGTPRHFGPCGDVLHHNRALLFKHFERRYTYFIPVTPPCNECLLVPFYVDGRAVGTIWAITHDPPQDANSKGKMFDAEDLRMLEALGRFATAAYQVWIGLTTQQTITPPVTISTERASITIAEA